MGVESTEATSVEGGVRSVDQILAELNAEEQANGGGILDKISDSIQAKIDETQDEIVSSAFDAVTGKFTDKIKDSISKGLGESVENVIETQDKIYGISDKITGAASSLGTAALNAVIDKVNGSDGSEKDDTPSDNTSGSGNSSKDASTQEKFDNLVNAQKSQKEHPTALFEDKIAYGDANYVPSERDLASAADAQNRAALSGFHVKALPSINPVGKTLSQVQRLMKYGMVDGNSPEAQACSDNIMFNSLGSIDMHRYMAPPIATTVKVLGEIHKLADNAFDINDGNALKDATDKMFEDVRAFVTGDVQDTVHDSALNKQKEAEPELTPEERKKKYENIVGDNFIKAAEGVKQVVFDSLSFI